MIRPMWSRRLIVVLVVAVVGCGGEPTLSADSADELHAQVAAVRDAAQEGDRDAALEALDGLADQVRDLEAGGSLAEADADALRRGIGRARRRVRAEVAEPAPTATATATATPVPTATPEPQKAKPPKGEGKPPKEKGHGKGKD
jgi:hypothetical protein